ARPLRLLRLRPKRPHRLKQPQLRLRRLHQLRPKRLHQLRPSRLRPLRLKPHQQERQLRPRRLSSRRPHPSQTPRAPDIGHDTTSTTRAPRARGDKTVMAEFTAKDVKALRDATGAGMMDAKRALEENSGDAAAASTWLRERGLGKAAERSGRDNAQGAVAVARNSTDTAVALVELKSETDFVAKSPQFTGLLDTLTQAVADEGDGAIAAHKDAVDDLKVTLKENIEVGQVVRFEAADGNLLDTYLHVQNGRGVNGILVELAGGSAELAHDLAVHIAFGRPGYLDRDSVPAEQVSAERAVLEAETRNEGKPEQAWPKIVDGKLNGWFKRVPGGVLLDQPYAKDDKRSVAQVLDGATIVRFAQVIIEG
ncbi:MAG: translation elongation factor Ts, partial [Acidimicrobiales bacterium]